MNNQTAKDDTSKDFKRRLERLDSQGVPRSVSQLARSAAAFASGDSISETGFLALRNQSLGIETDGSHFIAAVYYYLTPIGCPGASIDLVQFITGVTGGDSEKIVELTDAVIAEGMNLSESAIMKKRKSLKEWMKKENYQVLSIEEGELDIKTKRHAPTRYRSFVAPIAAKIVLLARNGHLWSNHDARTQRKAIKDAAVEVAWETPEAPTPSLKERKKKKVKDPVKEIAGRRKTIITNFRKMIVLEFGQSADPRTMWTELAMEMQDIVDEEVKSMEEAGF